jgi:Xaa-Pro aminopeptidase
MRGRGDRLEARLAERELDRMLVTDLTNVRYLTGFTGTNGACVCGPDVRLFLTDFRYTERAAAEVEGWETVTITGDWLKGIAERLEGRVGFEDDQMSVRLLGKLKEKLAEGVEMVAAGGRVEELRRVKDDEELAKIAEASKLADEVWRWSLEQGLAGRRERDVARAAEARIRELGGDPSFPAIVAAGPNGALPHAEPGEREIGRGELVVFDMGAQVDGYCSDGTRTFATGEPDPEARAVYEVVREAQAAALEAIRAGVKGEDVDGAARRVIDDAGHGERFGHALGHGVGLEVHEGPRLAQRSDDVLAAGEVVTVEPGVYLPGRLGVRIEDLVVVTEDGLRNLSGLPKQLQIVA